MVVWTYVNGRPSGTHSGIRSEERALEIARDELRSHTYGFTVAVYAAEYLGTADTLVFAASSIERI